jgi:hypothetical protein
MLQTRVPPIVALRLKKERAQHRWIAGNRRLAADLSTPPDWGGIYFWSLKAKNSLGGAGLNFSFPS